MDKDEALKRALEAFEWNYNTDLDNIPACEKWAKMLKENITAIKEVLAQPEQKPVAWQVKYRDDEGIPQIAWFHHPVHSKSPLAKRPYTEEPLYTTPPQRKWVGLTEEEIEAIGKDDKVLLAQFHTSVKAIDEMKDPTAQIMHLVIRQQGFDFAKAIEAQLREKNGG